VKSNRLFIWLPVLLIVFPIAFILRNIELTYTIDSKGILYPAQEWILSRSTEGNLINSIKNNSNNSITQYTVTEFQRGDLASFKMIPGIFDKEIINEGDTIGIVISQNERRRLIELNGELQRQEKLLSVYASGAKPDEIRTAYERTVLAQQEYQTQERITERNRLLFERAHIPQEEYEISVNELNIKRQNYLISQSQYEAMLSGAKQEQLDYVQAYIQALRVQIQHVEDLMNSFIITSPITGRIAKQQGTSLLYDAIIRVGDINSYIMLVPVDVYNLPYISIGQKAFFKSPASKEQFEGVITDKDNSIQVLNGRQKVFLTVSLKAPEDKNIFYPNMLVEVSIPSEKESIGHFLSRLINEIYNN
jgi:hypothetical protein